MSNNEFLIYRASAGSGKTYTIAQEYIKELLSGTSHRNILAVTFTKDATNEMKMRILEELYKKGELGKLKEIVNDYSRFNVSTIDSFFQMIVRNVAKELGIGSKFNIELNQDLPVKEAVHSLIEDAGRDKAVLKKITAFLEHKLEEDKWQIEPSLRKFAAQIFSETFQESEKKLLEQLADSNKIKNTIAECKKIKNEFEKEMLIFVQKLEDTINANNIKGVKGYLTDLKEKKYPPPTSTVEKKDILKPIVEEIENLKNKKIKSYNSAVLLLKNIYQLDLLKDIAEKMNEQDKEQNRFMLARTNQLLSGLIGESDVPFIYEKIGAEIKSVVIDEFQDTSKLQWKNFRILLSEVVGHHFGMIVGDVKQSIYRWRNGDWTILNNLDNDNLFKKANFNSLQKNWRSSKYIIEFNNRLFENAKNYFTEQLKKAYSDVKQEPKPDQKENGFVSVDFCKKDDTLQRIVEIITECKTHSVKDSDICILCRNNKQVRNIAEELTKHNITVISEDAFLLRSSLALKKIITALRILTDKEWQISVAEIAFKTGESYFELAEFMKEKVQKYKSNSLYDIVLNLCKEFNLSDNAGDVPFLYAFADKLLAYISQNTGNISAFLDYWDEKMSKESIPTPTNCEGITLKTIHKSKGLAFHTVIVPFVDFPMKKHSTAFQSNLVWCKSKNAPFNISLMPVEYSKNMKNSVFETEYKMESEEQEMDNLNILYVALTRAENNLFIISTELSKLEGASLKISTILYDTVKKLPNGFCGYSQQNDAGDNYQIGEIVPHNAPQKNEEKNDNPFKITPVPLDNQMKFISNKPEIKFLSQNIKFLQSESVQKGNLIHGIFERIIKKTDVEKSLARAVAGGEICTDELENYRKEINRYIAAKEEWFSDEFEVLNECSVLFRDKDGKSVKKRPDRIMVSRDKKNAVIVDYKTGKKDKEHHRQVKEYMDLIKNLGYSKVDGFLWYFTNNEIEQVED
ncbi:DNA helicase [Fibrobacterales bacterium]|nr:DNA helicase [Fibrobacterales bacterium]